jgi:uncharacterized protein (UPF0332 family)/predicted nucleotidyltransferase
MRSNVLGHLTENERAALDELLARLRKKYRKRLVRVVLFGSKARGDADAESDIDLLIVVKPDGAELKEDILHEKSGIELTRGVAFGGLTLSDPDFREIQKLRAPIYRSIRNEGISLYPRIRRYSRAPLEVNGGKENVDEHKKVQIKSQFEKCQEAIDDAKFTLENGRYRTAVSRGYYAVFTIASAVLFVLDVVRVKHRGVQSAFGEFFVKERRFDPEYSDIFERARKLREEADYKPVLEKLAPESAKRIVADCERFIARMEQYLRQVGALE